MTDVSTEQVFEDLPKFFHPDKAVGTNAAIQFDLSGENAGKYWVKIADGQATTGQGEVDNPNLTLSADAADWVKIALGHLDATAAFMSGKLKLKGDMGLAMRFGSMFKRT